MNLIRVGNRVLNLDRLLVAVLGKPGDSATVFLALTIDNKQADMIPFCEIFDGEEAVELREKLGALCMPPGAPLKFA